MTISLEEHIARAHYEAMPSNRRSDGKLRETWKHLSTNFPEAADAWRIGASAAIAAVREREEADLRMAASRMAASRYMASVKALGQQSGFNGLTFFQAPIMDPMPKDLGLEAIKRWQELDSAGKALNAALSLPAPDPAAAMRANEARIAWLLGLLRGVRDQRFNCSSDGVLRGWIDAALKGKGEEQ